MHIQTHLQPSTPTNVHAEENIDNQVEFTNPFCTPVHEHAESSPSNIGNSNVHTSNQPQDYEYRWTKDHRLTQVCGNPSKPVQTRQQLATDPEMCMFALTMSIVEPKNIKEAMADSAWIEAMQEELHQHLVDQQIKCKAVCIVQDNQQDETEKQPQQRLKVSFRHLRVTINMGLWYPKNEKKSGTSGFELTAFSDADHAGCVDTRKSTSGGIQFLGDKLVSWMSKKQNCTAMSSAEAEYVALSASCCSECDGWRTQLQD
ncbi:hypothetical protein Tco_1209830 [Tanacetum coccineum]